MTTVLFDDKYEVLHDRIDIKAISPITTNEYFVRGTTALLDAIGKTIKKIGNVQKNTAEEHRAGKVLFVITTDGMENASREYDYSKIKSMIEKRKSKHGWEFIFLGANIDAINVAEHIGIAKNRAKKFISDRKGWSKFYEDVSDIVLCCTASDEWTISDDWGSKTEEDYKKRKTAEVW